MNNIDEEIRRLRWSCRRGLLELDIVLQRFLATNYDTLSEPDRKAFNDLLELSDNTLLAYLNNLETPTDPRLQAIVKNLR